MKIPIDKLDGKLPLLVTFKSQFCSKCRYNRKLLDEAISLEDLKINHLEEDIASVEGLHQFIKPRSVPFLVIIDNQGVIQLEFDGLLNSKMVKSILMIIKRLNERGN